jgi:hypothetical protein
MSEPQEAPHDEHADLDHVDVDEETKKKFAEGALDGRSERGDPNKGEASHGAIGQTAPQSESKLTSHD